ncbi:MAG: domain, repeat protein [Candidatus Eremiobacteraeota bacterium]|nr:domain, repeat protein [Candidatus Eremiobacteraeota bacterium]
MSQISDDLARAGAAPVTPPPPFSITSFMPVNGLAPDPFTGAPGTTVQLNGTGLSVITKVTFNGVAAPIVSKTDTQIIVTVPTGATSGPISISDGTSTVQALRDFTVLPPVPDISGFRPKSGPVGTVVTINGHHLAGITTVTFNKIPATQIVTGANQQLTVTVPPGATTGPIVVKGPNGSASTAPKTYTVTP